MNVDKAIEEVSKDIGLVFKDKQYDSIKSFCQGHDSFVSLPTGYGKSLIFAVLPLVMDKMKGNRHHSILSIMVKCADIKYICYMLSIEMIFDTIIFINWSGYRR